MPHYLKIFFFSVSPSRCNYQCSISFLLFLGLLCDRHLLPSGLVLCPELSLCVCFIYHRLLQLRLVWDTSPSLCHFSSLHFSQSFQIYWCGPFDGSLITLLSVRCSNVLKHKLCFVYFFGLLLMFLIQPLIPKFVSCNCHLVCVCVYMYDCVCVSTVSVSTCELCTQASYISGNSMTPSFKHVPWREEPCISYMVSLPVPLGVLGEEVQSPSVVELHSRPECRLLDRDSLEW